MSNSLQPHGLYSPWNSLGQNTGVGSLSLLQGIFPTQGSNPGLPHCRQILYQLTTREALVRELIIFVNSWTLQNSGIPQSHSSSKMTMTKTSRLKTLA